MFNVRIEGTPFLINIAHVAYVEERENGITVGFLGGGSIYIEDWDLKKWDTMLQSITRQMTLMGRQ